MLCSQGFNQRKAMCLSTVGDGEAHLHLQALNEAGVLPGRGTEFVDEVVSIQGLTRKENSCSQQSARTIKILLGNGNSLLVIDQ